MSSRLPATVTLSLEEFARHGGQTGPHRDGWGIAYYDRGDVRLLKEATAAADSACVRFIESQDLESRLVVSHIRKATQGAVALRNTQPYVRELGGRMHVFAHNGHLPQIQRHPGFPLGTYRPVGETDSEHAFCALCARLQSLWLQSEGQPEFARRFECVEAFAREISQLGPANFIYSDGEVVFAHGHRRNQSDGSFGPPGLWSLARECESAEEVRSTAGLTIASPGAQQALLVASVPLSDEAWTPLPEGELIAMADGRILDRRMPGAPRN